MIDLPQVVDVIANPRGAWFLTRGRRRTSAAGSTQHGLHSVSPEPGDLPALLRREARLDGDG